MKTNRLSTLGRGATALLLGASFVVMGACSDLLDVDLPSQLTDDALNDPSGAGVQVASAIALFECGYSAFAWVALGHEDVFESIAGVASGSHVYRFSAAQGDCDSDSEDGSFYDQIQGARAFAAQTYDRIQNVWDPADVPDREELSAQAALYAAAALDNLGEYYCEMAIDGGPLLTPNQTLTEAETWIGTALGHIASAGGDFEMPYGIASSAEEMAYGLRARIRWAKGDMSGAVSDAQRVSDGFMAFVTRESGPQRRNKVYDAGTAVGFSGIIGVNDWWTGPPNPVTGQNWPSPIPFTGYLNLGIGADGRAVSSDGMAVLASDTDAVADTRVQHFIKSIQGPEPRDVPDKFKSEDDDIPLVNWKEMVLIRAEAAGGQEAIDLVNLLRTDAGLPLVTYADPGDAQEIQYMILEERRRALWLEGRWWASKILNTDIMWFPRGNGTTPAQGYNYQGGVRLAMPQNEFNINENMSLADRATGCDASQRPTISGF